MGLGQVIKNIHLWFVGFFDHVFWFLLCFCILVIEVSRGLIYFNHHAQEACMGYNIAFHLILLLCACKVFYNGPIKHLQFVGVLYILTLYMRPDMDFCLLK